MKKKQSKKKIQNKKKKNYSETTAFANLEKTSIPVTKQKRSSSGIPKYVADRMARRIFFTAGCLLYTSPSPRDGRISRMPSSA